MQIIVHFCCDSFFFSEAFFDALILVIGDYENWTRAFEGSSSPSDSRVCVWNKKKKPTARRNETSMNFLKDPGKRNRDHISDTQNHQKVSSSVRKMRGRGKIHVAQARFVTSTFDINIYNI